MNGRKEERRLGWGDYDALVSLCCVSRLEPGWGKE